MITLNIPLGSTRQQANKQLQELKDATVSGLLNHPGLSDLIQEDPAARALSLVYLEANEHLRQDNEPTAS